jgi:sugar O-acyltransferase (sialic acid O-acetyltransferase NeuD family)
MQEVIILGAGGLGREVLAYALESREWTILGFLDANPRALDGFGCAAPILGDPLTVELPPHVAVLCAIGDPRTKLRLCRKMRERGARFTSLIHRSAIVGPGCVLGHGCIAGPHSVVTTNVSIGDFVTLNAYCCVGHDAVVGDGCTLSPHCTVTGGAVLGESVFMGTHASVLPRVRVGAGAVIAAGSAAMWPVRPYSTVIGVPACRIAATSLEKNK